MKISLYQWLYIVHIYYASINSMDYVSPKSMYAAPSNIKEQHREYKKRRTEEKKHVISENGNRSVKKRLVFNIKTASTTQSVASSEKK